MKRTLCKIISVLMLVTMLFSTGIAAISSSAASESDYVATFTIKTDKTAIKAGEKVVVSLDLKTNYYIFAMEVPIIYDGDFFEVQNTSATSTKSFLTFKGKLASAYNTNGNWKSPSVLYTKGNSDPEYWSQTDVMNRYKIAFASWAANSALNNGKAIKLSESETIVSFVLKAKQDIEDVSGLVFISPDFRKTSSHAGGRFFCGRSKTEKIDASTGGYVSVGQTLKVIGKVPPKEDIKEDGIVAIDFKSTVSLKDYLADNVVNSYRFKWESADESIVTVDEKGNIYGAKKGETTVTAKSTDGKYTKTFTVTVSYSALQWIIIIVLFGWIWYI